MKNKILLFIFVFLSCIFFSLSFSGFALIGHIIVSLQAPDVFDCSFACFKDSRCRSYNFRVSGPLHLCELSSESVYTKPENYTVQGDMIYYDAGRVNSSNAVNV